jgi:hypothetical protein
MSVSTAHKHKGGKKGTRKENTDDLNTQERNLRDSMSDNTDLKLSELGRTGSGYSVNSSDSRIKLITPKTTIHPFEIEEPTDSSRRDLEAKRCWPSFMTIVTFLVSEQSKKKRSFQIGVFTVFIVVAFLTLLENIVDVSSVAFVKIA